MKPKGWRKPDNVRERHDEIFSLSGEGIIQGEIAAMVGVDRTTVNHHLRGWCSCLEPLGRRDWQRLLDGVYWNVARERTTK